VAPFIGVYMSDTLPNIELPAAVWVELYLESHIPAGKQLLVQNIGSCDVYLATSAQQPTDETTRQILVRGQWAVNDEGDETAWAYCNNTDGLINVRGE